MSATGDPAKSGRAPGVEGLAFYQVIATGLHPAMLNDCSVQPANKVRYFCVNVKHVVLKSCHNKIMCATYHATSRISKTNNSSKNTFALKAINSEGSSAVPLAKV